eukprot:scaffold1277_cov253-Pinguiococcus_pyrenoidosus.AAC.17
MANNACSGRPDWRPGPQAEGRSPGVGRSAKDLQVQENPKRGVASRRALSHLIHREIAGRFPLKADEYIEEGSLEKRGKRAKTDSRGAGVS